MSDNYYKNTTDNKWKNTTDNKWNKLTVVSVEPYYTEGPIVVATPVSPGEYGRKPYMRGGDASYSSMMRRPTDRAIWNELESKWGKAEKQSEFKKPYLFPKEDYSEMEHYYPSPHMSLPDPTRPTPAPAPHGWVGWYIHGCSLTCTPSIIRDCNKIYCCVLNPAWQPVASIKITGPATLTSQGKKARKTGDRICFTIDDDAQRGDKIKIKVSTRPAFGQLKGGYCEASISIACTKCDCGEADYFYYDDAGSDDTIDRDGTAVITIIGGCPPYHWSVAGTGFTFPTGETEGLTNTLAADDTACGTATITVTDACGDTCTGYVRCTTGQWVYKEGVNTTGSPAGCYTFCGPTQQCQTSAGFDTIQGKSRWVIGTSSQCCVEDSAPDSGCDPSAIAWASHSYPDIPCGSPSACHPSGCSGNCRYRPCLACYAHQYSYYEWEC